MFLSRVTIQNFRCFGDGAQALDLSLKPGLNAIVGENDCGKSAIIDALRFALGTRDQDWYRLEDTDFHDCNTACEIRIVCAFEGLSSSDKRAFIEYLTHASAPNNAVLFVNWIARDAGEQRRGRPYRRVEVHSGRDGNGPTMAPEARELLRAIYLRPLRDAQQALCSGRGSRLAQVLQHSPKIRAGADKCDPNKPLKDQNLSVAGISKLVDGLLAKQSAVLETRQSIDHHLNRLSLIGDRLKSTIEVAPAQSADSCLRQMLEKLDLSVDSTGRAGLGSDNLLFMACEMLLLAEEDEGSKLLLIEEPEAHLHPQRQLRAMKFLQDEAHAKRIQVILTTHSPNLASAIPLDKLVMLRASHAFAMSKEHTQLDESDYRFLERFLDVTKANLFFARAVMIVEGDAENILLPILARLLGRDFAEYGVSIVNVGGVGFGRYARIFLRRSDTSPLLGIPVACVTDMDVMPDCAPTILKYVDNDNWPSTGGRGGRKWRATRDFTAKELEELRQKKRDRASGPGVVTFVSDHWTLEYDLAYSGLAREVYVAAQLASGDEVLNDEALAQAIAAAEGEFVDVQKEAGNSLEILASMVYAEFKTAKTGARASKPVAAQYLAEILQRKKQTTPEQLQKMLPKYLVEAIEHVTSPIPGVKSNTGESVNV